MYLGVKSYVKNIALCVHQCIVAKSIDSKIWTFYSLFCDLLFKQMMIKNLIKMSSWYCNFNPSA